MASKKRTRNYRDDRKTILIILSDGQYDVLDAIANDAKVSKAEVLRRGLKSMAGKHGYLFPEEDFTKGPKGRAA